MRRVVLTTGAVFLLTALAAAQGRSKVADKHAQPPPQFPKTVDEAVLIIRTKWLSPKDLDWILRNPQKEVVFTLYRPFGTGVRNQFHLWGDNQELKDSCGDNNPEGCSVVILNRLWESVRADADPALVHQLDCQFQLAESVHINEKGFYKLTTGEVVKAMQAQIDEQLAKLAASGTPVCQSSLTLEVVGKPDMHCFVDAPHPKDLVNRPEETTLEGALQQLGHFNLFSSTHLPQGHPELRARVPVPDSALPVRVTSLAGPYPAVGALEGETPGQQFLLAEPAHSSCIAASFGGTIPLRPRIDPSGFIPLLKL